ncbi:hypothetical protein COCNU_07G012530 [Cocos nucifera]|uniref:Uncharacterized protein n=1 Tax=Cocos nucifera TaxID=13894 RepID=A0A8K0IFJ7_COCNU|nr:hypothetical protein COCNU_07G012530 [Cocos nucifera]
MEGSYASKVAFPPPILSVKEKGSAVGSMRSKVVVVEEEEKGLSGSMRSGTMMAGREWWRRGVAVDAEGGGCNGGEEDRDDEELDNVISGGVVEDDETMDAVEGKAGDLEGVGQRRQLRGVGGGWTQSRQGTNRGGA